MDNQITPVSPIAVANFFIRKAQDAGDLITPMKLVKLVYISHGWYLGLYGKPLLPETAEAWKYGPVIPSIYHQFKHYGNSPIKSQAPETVHTNRNTLTYPDITEPELAGFLEEVWEAYNPYSAVQLSTLTHQPGTPWYITWHEKGGKENKAVPIPNELILAHYKEKADSTN